MQVTNRFLFWAEFVLVAVIGIKVLFSVFPAYRRSRQRAFMYLALGFMIVLFNSVADHTISLWHMSHQQYVTYQALRRATRLPGFVLVACGIISLTRLYLSTS